MRLSDGVFEGDDTRGALVGVVEAGEFQDGCDVLPVLREDVAHRGAVREVVFAVGKLEAALHEVGVVVIGVVEAGRDPEAEEISGVEVGHVQRIDVSAKCFAEGAG